MAAPGFAGSAAVGRWWGGLATRERRMVALAGALVLLALIWLLALAPALRTLARAPLQIEAADAQLQTMQRLAAEASEMRAAAPVAPDQAAAALQAATTRLSDAGRLTVQGDRAVLTLNAVRVSALRDWLAEARSGARARPVEVTLTRGAQGLSGTVVLALGGSS